MSRRSLVLAAVVGLAGCKQDASFTPLVDPLPSVEDTSASAGGLGGRNGGFFPTIG